MEAWEGGSEEGKEIDQETDPTAGIFFAFSGKNAKTRGLLCPGDVLHAPLTFLKH